MQIFAKLVLVKLRFILLLASAPDMAKIIEERVSAEDFAYLNGLSKTVVGAAKGISLDVLFEFLKASQLIGRAFIQSLPLELALMKIVGQEKGV